MEMLKSKSFIALTIMILGVSYLTGIDNVNASQSTSNNRDVISENA